MNLISIHSAVPVPESWDQYEFKSTHITPLIGIEYKYYNVPNGIELELFEEIIGESAKWIESTITMRGLSNSKIIGTQITNPKELAEIDNMLEKHTCRKATDL